MRRLILVIVLLVLFRIVGKRSLAQITTFDFVLLLIISEAIQQAMIDTDNSMMNAALLVITLLGIDVALSLLKGRSSTLEKLGMRFTSTGITVPPRIRRTEASPEAVTRS